MASRRATLHLFTIIKIINKYEINNNENTNWFYAIISILLSIWMTLAMSTHFHFLIELLNTKYVTIKWLWFLCFYDLKMGGRHTHTHTHLLCNSFVRKVLVIRFGCDFLESNQFSLPFKRQKSSNNGNNSSSNNNNDNNNTGRVHLCQFSCSVIL